MRKSKPDFAVLDGKHSGEVITVAKASKNTDAYVVQVAEVINADTQTPWVILAVTSHCRYHHQGLKHATYYKFRVALVSSSGTTDYSTAVTKLVI